MGHFCVLCEDLRSFQSNQNLEICLKSCYFFQPKNSRCLEFLKIIRNFKWEDFCVCINSLLNFINLTS